MHITPPIYSASRVLIADTPASVLLTDAIVELLAETTANALNSNSADRQPKQPAPAASRIGDNPDAVMLRVIGDVLETMLHQSPETTPFLSNYDRLAIVAAIAVGDWNERAEGFGALDYNRKRVAAVLNEMSGKQHNTMGVTFNKVRELAQC
jgi:hypothetical protein